MSTTVESHAYFGDDDAPEVYPAEMIPTSATSILEIGPGVGAGTFQLLERSPAAHIVCVEPDPVGRAVLLWRLRDKNVDPDRVSVLPLRLEDIGSRFMQFQYVVSRHVVCQLHPSSRRDFWRALHQQMSAETLTLIDDHFGPADTSETIMGLRRSTTHGRLRVERWFGSTKLSPTTMVVDNELRTYDREGVLVSVLSATREMSVVSAAEVEAEVQAAGMRCDPNEREGWLVMRRVWGTAP